MILHLGLMRPSDDVRSSSGISVEHGLSSGSNASIRVRCQASRRVVLREDHHLGALRGGEVAIRPGGVG